ncbi:MAG: tyrosine-protein phosphatase [Candidatus Omnitrophica bacterium]|nr:tyrosine-protein phosphatase [Candidatus Omnitrophota bacterium]
MRLSAKRACLVFVSVALFLLTVSLAYSATTVEDLRKRIKNFHEVNNSIYRSGQPDSEAFTPLKDFGIRTIIDLRQPNEGTEREKLLAESAGLTYISIPMDGFSKPPDEIIDKILNLLESDQGPYLVHCKHGRERTGVVIACYRVKHDRWTADKAYDEMGKHGYRWLFHWALKDYLFEFSKKLEDEPREGKSASAAA